MRKLPRRRTIGIQSIETLEDRRLPSGFGHLAPMPPPAVAGPVGVRTIDGSDLEGLRRSDAANPPPPIPAGHSLRLLFAPNGTGVEGPNGEVGPPHGNDFGVRTAAPNNLWDQTDRPFHPVGGERSGWPPLRAAVTDFGRIVSVFEVRGAKSVSAKGASPDSAHVHAMTSPPVDAPPDGGDGKGDTNPPDGETAAPSPALREQGFLVRAFGLRAATQPFPGSVSMDEAGAKPFAGRAAWVYIPPASSYESSAARATPNPPTVHLAPTATADAAPTAPGIGQTTTAAEHGAVGHGLLPVQTADSRYGVASAGAFAESLVPGFEHGTEDEGRSVETARKTSDSSRSADPPAKRPEEPPPPEAGLITDLLKAETDSMQEALDAFLNSYDRLSLSDSTNPESPWAPLLVLGAAVAAEWSRRRRRRRLRWNVAFRDRDPSSTRHKFS